MVKPREKLALPKKKAHISIAENISDLKKKNHFRVDSKILTPIIRGNYKIEIDLDNISSKSSSSEDLTDSDTYEYVHSTMEKIEYLVRAKPDIRRIKGNRRSVGDISIPGKTKENLKKSLAALSEFLPDDVMNEYYIEGIDFLPWPINKVERNLCFGFN